MFVSTLEKTDGPFPCIVDNAPLAIFLLYAANVR
jgi:hypothetical protein